MVSALIEFEKDDFDLVLLDIQMPKLDGLGAARGIRNYETAHLKTRTPIVALTAYGQTEERIASMDAGCDLHLTKPLSKIKLLNAVNDATHSH